MSSAPIAGETPATSAAGASPAATDTPEVDIVRLNFGQAPAATADPNTDPTPAPKAPEDGKADQPAPNKTDDPNRAGGPEALRTDLAGERRARQSAETERDTVKGQLDAVLKALGLDTKPTEDPATAVQRAQANEADARREVAVVRNAPRDARGNYTVDVNALLDSRSFMASIADVDPNDAAGIAAKIAAHVQTNPPAPVVRYNAGSGDVAATGDPGTGPVDMDALIRGR